jgi:hypothetical protein
MCRSLAAPAVGQLFLIHLKFLHCRTQELDDCPARRKPGLNTVYCFVEFADQRCGFRMTTNNLLSPTGLS